MAGNNYYGFTHGGTLGGSQFAAAANPAAFTSTQAAYGVPAASGISAAQTFPTQRAGTIYDTAAAYPAATPVTYAVTPGTTAVSSYDYGAFAGRAAASAAAAAVGVTYDTATKAYYQQTPQATSATTGVVAAGHIVAAANTVPNIVAVSSADLQGWQAQSYAAARQTTTAGKNIYHAPYQAAVPTTRQLSVPQMVAKSQPTGSYIAQQQSQQGYSAQYSAAGGVSQANTQQQQSSASTSYGYSSQPAASQTQQGKAASVGTIGQGKKGYQQQKAASSVSQQAATNAASYSGGISSSTTAATNGGYSASSGGYATSYPASAVHGVTNKVKMGGSHIPSYSYGQSAYDSTLYNTALYMNQGGGGMNRSKMGGGASQYKHRPGLGAAPTPKPFNKRSPPKPEQLHYCDVCKISCAGVAAYNDHLQGQKHKKRVARTKTTETTPNVPKPRPALPTFYCELCDVECTMADAYAAHLRGTKHCKVLKLYTRLGKPIPPVDPKLSAAITILNPISQAPQEGAKSAAPAVSVTSAPGTQMTAVGPSVSTAENKERPTVVESAFIDDRPTVGLEYIEEERNAAGKLLSYDCKLCDCKFSDPNAKEMHVKGRKHRLAYKKKVDPKLKVEVKTAVYKMEDKFGRKKLVRKNFKLKQEARADDDNVQSAQRHDVGPSRRHFNTDGARLLAEETDRMHLLLVQEYRRYDEKLQGYREWCRKYGSKAAGPPPMPPSLPLNLGPVYTPIRRPVFTPPLPLSPLRFAMPPGPMPCGLMEPPVKVSRDDRHVMARHREIAPSERDIRFIEQVVRHMEVAIKRVSDELLMKKGQAEGSVVAKKEGSSGMGHTGGASGNERTLIGVHRVGMFSKSLLLQGESTVELVILSRTKPTLTLLNTAVSLLSKQLEEVAPEIGYTVIADPTNAGIVVQTVANTDRQVPLPLQLRVNLSLTSPVIREEIMALSEKAITSKDTDGTIGGNGNVKVEITPDPPDILSKIKCLEALAAIRHAKWFQARVFGQKRFLVVIRILRDLCRRIPTWAPFDSWPMELLVEKCLSSMEHDTAPAYGLRRVFEAISSGVLLPDGPGLQDPCEKGMVDALMGLKPQEIEDITAAAQLALRLVSFKQIHKVLGMDPLPFLPKMNKGKGGAGDRKRRRENSIGGKSEAGLEKKDKKDEEGVKIEEQESTASDTALFHYNEQQ